MDHLSVVGVVGDGEDWATVGCGKIDYDIVVRSWEGAGAPVGGVAPFAAQGIDPKH